ncbi:hypothetical protein BB558_002424 [Smittium angustum]|uniref:Uncharacterized protein n=1 Tax=Smittium angustum TaxID=133377 RepID=A0A2U1J8R9_SMIAN|nr:hypothetical protein BB558_002424 [Smittium angustum]
MASEKTELSKNIIELNRDVYRLEKSLEESYVLMEKLKSDISEEKKISEKLDIENKNILEKIKILEKSENEKIAEMEESNKKLELDLDSINKRLKYAEVSLEKEKEEKNKYIVMYDKSQSEISNLKSEKEKSDRSLELSTSELKVLKDKIVDDQKIHSETHQEIEILKEENKKKGETVEMLKREKIDMIHKIKENEMMLVKMKEAADIDKVVKQNMETSYTRISDIKDSTEAELYELRQEYNKLQERLNEVENDKFIEKKGFIAFEGEFYQKINSNELKIQVLENKIKELNESLRYHENQKTNTETNLVNKKAEIKEKGMYTEPDIEDLKVRHSVLECRYDGEDKTKANITERTTQEMNEKICSNIVGDPLELENKVFDGFKDVSEIGDDMCLINEENINQIKMIEEHFTEELNLVKNNEGSTKVSERKITDIMVLNPTINRTGTLNGPDIKNKDNVMDCDINNNQNDIVNELEGDNEQALKVWVEDLLDLYASSQLENIESPFMPVVYPLELELAPTTRPKKTYQKMKRNETALNFKAFVEINKQVGGTINTMNKDQDDYDKLLLGYPPNKNENNEHNDFSLIEDLMDIQFDKFGGEDSKTKKNEKVKKKAVGRPTKGKVYRRKK